MKRKLYLLFFLVFSVLSDRLVAQAPGGISSNLTMWVQANSNTTASAGLLSAWTYVNDGTKSFTAGAGTQPTLATNTLNFSPVILFPGGQYMDGPTGANAPITTGSFAYTAFVVWKSTDIVDYQRVWSQRSTGFNNSDAFAFSTSTTATYGDESATPPFTQALTRGYTSGAWNISQINILNQASNDCEIIDQGNFSSGPLLATTARNFGNIPPGIASSVNRIGANYDNAQPLKGAIAEIIVFNGPISAGAARNQIFSYLSLKYGIPLSASLVSSSAATIWDATAGGSAFNTSVFGLAQDNGSNLLVNKSNSSLTGNGDGTGISGAGNVILDNPSALADQGFLLVGNDNGGFTQVTGTKAGTQRFTQRWKVQTSGSVGTVNLHFDFTGLTPTSGTVGVANTWQIQIDQDGDGDFTTGAQTYISPANFTGNILNFTGLTFTNGQVFTIIGSPTALPVTWKNFTANYQDNLVYLNWSIDNNQSAKTYQVQQSTDGVNFTPVGEVANDPTVKTYNYVYTPTTNGAQYFRINEVDIDGQSILSKIVSVNAQAADFAIRVLSNPVQNNSVDIELNAAKSSTASFQLWSYSGAQIANVQKQVSPGISKTSLPLSNVAAGAYILTVKIGNNSFTQRIIKQ